MLKYMVLFVATSLRNVQFAFLSQGVLSLRNQFSVVFNRKVSDGWLYFRNSYEKGLSLSLDRAVDEQWFQHNGGQSSCPGDQDGSDLTGISENWAVAFYKPVCGEKEKPLFRVWDSAHSLMIIILQLLLRTSPCSGPSSPPLSLQTLAQSRSAPPPLATSKPSALHSEVVTVHCEFVLMLSINFLFQTNPLISIHIFNF